MHNPKLPNIQMVLLPTVKQIYDGSYTEHLSRTVFPKYQKGN